MKKKIWYIFEHDSIKSGDLPCNILQDYAKRVSEDTDDILFGEVRTQLSNSDKYVYRLLVNKKFPLSKHGIYIITVTLHDNFYIYPVTCMDHSSSITFSCSTPKDLIKCIEDIITSVETRKILFNIANETYE